MFTISSEVDIIPIDNDEGKSDLIDGPIGESSYSNQSFGVYAQGVSFETAKAPIGWQSRWYSLKTQTLAAQFVPTPQTTTNRSYIPGKSSRCQTFIYTTISMSKSEIRFVLDRSTGVPAYRQIENQVIAALRFGRLEVGDQLPTVTEVVKNASVNVNTVLKAYKNLEHQGITRSRQGIGTIIVDNPYRGQEQLQRALSERLTAVFNEALEFGLDPRDLHAAVMAALNRFQLAVNQDQTKGAKENG